MDGELVPHHGLAFVDRCAHSGVWRSSHSETHEQLELEGDAGWSIVFDEDGFGYLVDGADRSETEVDLNDRFNLHLAALPCGRRLVMFKGEAGEQHHFFLDTKRRIATEETFTILVGPTQATHQFRAGVFEWPRHGFRMYWCLVDSYTSLAFSMLSGVPSRWAWQSLPAFSRQLDQHIPLQVLRSQEYNANGDAP